jgi:hypothetical protein
MDAARLVYLPERAEPRFFLWGGASPELAAHGRPHRATLVDDRLAVRAIDGVALPLLDGVAALAAMDAAPPAPSIAVWRLAANLALDLVARGRVVPRAQDGEARWAVALALAADADRVAQLARSFPLAAHAVPLGKGQVWAAESLLRAFLDRCADTVVRRAGALPGGERWEPRLAAALTGEEAAFAPDGFGERSLLTDLDEWTRPALGPEPGAPRACFRLDLPGGEDRFPLRFFLQSGEDPSLLVPAPQVLRGRSRAALRLGPGADERMLRALGTAARLFPPLARALAEARPGEVLLDTGEAWQFLDSGASALAEAGLGVILPAELTRSGQRRLRLRMRVGGKSARGAAGVVDKARTALSQEEVLSFRWEAALGGHTLSQRDLAALARLKAPLVRFRGQWVAVDPAELAAVREQLATGGGTLRILDALAAALREEQTDGATAVPIDVVAEGRLAAVIARLRTGDRAPLAAPMPPDGFRGQLRPYQERGTAWLAMMAELGLGACLADDMGLGKTVQLIAYLLQRGARSRPALLVCPTSLVGNWERELARFAPGLEVVRHHGGERARSAAALERAGALVITTYGLLRRDAELLAGLDWDLVALDEAQNIKNARSSTARAARALGAATRVALTGTPVENRLAELWSISEFLNPGLLGPLESFRREVAVPIERHGRDDVAAGLARVVRPLLLRRLKSDPAVAADLPAKNEMRVVCTLSREQASLYQAAVDEAMRRIEEAEGIARRGQVLALITALKQICNHPAQYLGEPGPLAGRSGKLARLTEMLEEVVASGDRALVFSQFKEMGDRLVAEIGRALGIEVLFLHGGVSRARRDAMVARFQESGAAPPVFVLSVKAGGTGLNLTAAAHVFHYDRWWNPAVEDQATDRAHRIGQRRAVQVHKLVCAGTVEEKVDAMLEEKRGLASRIVGRGEQWVTELDDRGLRELFQLAGDAVVDEPELPRAVARFRS